jgi:hypothetical protein
LHNKAPEEAGKVVPLFKAVPSENGMARLLRATAGIEAAIMEQKEVIAAFRSTIAELRERIDQLGESCRFLHRTAGRIDMKPLRYKSLRLARIMDPHVADAIGDPPPATEPT